MIKTIKLLLLFVLCFAAMAAYQTFHDTLLHRPVVSVIISSYNMEKTLPAAIDSILNQTFPDWELIIIDDGSTDRTQNILESYKNKDSRIKVIKNRENLGLTASLNKGLKIAKGEYIARLDADDTSYPDRLMRQIGFMKKNALDLSGAALDTQDTKYQEGQRVTDDWLDTDTIKIHLVFDNIFAHSTTIFRKDFLTKFNLTYDVNYPYAEDYDLWEKIAMNGGKMGIMGGTPVTTYHYSVHSADWWNIADESFQKIRQRILKKIIPNITDDEIESPICQLLKLILKSNETTHVLNSEKLSEFEFNRCIPLLLFKHPSWQDSFFHLEKNRFRRRSIDDRATITRSENYITVKWDNWPVEYYKCSETECEKSDLPNDTVAKEMK